MSPPSHAPGSNIEDPGLAPAGAGETNMLAADARDAGNGPLPQYGPPTGRGKVPAIKSADVYRNGNVRIPPSPGLLFSPPFDPHHLHLLRIFPRPEGQPEYAPVLTLVVFFGIPGFACDKKVREAPADQGI
jgi:hypothetical protein